MFQFIFLHSFIIQAELSDLKTICEEANSYLAQFRINDNEVERLNQRLLELKCTLDFQEADIKNFIFNGRLLTYTKAREESIRNVVGELHMTSFTEINFNHCMLLMFYLSLKLFDKED